MPSGLGGGSLEKGEVKTAQKGRAHLHPPQTRRALCSTALGQQAGEVCVHGGHASECAGPSWGVGPVGFNIAVLHNVFSALQAA